MPQQSLVEVVDRTRVMWKQGLQESMSVVSCDFFADEAKATTDTMHVHVNRKYGLPAAKQQHASRGFRPDSLKTVQPRGALFYGEVAQEIKIEPATFCGDLTQNCLQTRRFGFWPIHIFNGFLYFVRRRIAYHFPRTKAFQQIVIGCSSLLVS